MLKSIDILIGLSVVMLVASMAVTAMTEFVTHIRNTRGRYLKTGIADLLRLINPAFDEEVADQIAEAVLTHPLIRDRPGRMGTIVHREELTKLLMELAAGNGPQPLPPAIQQKLKETLAAQGITDPVRTLDTIRSIALQMEKANPELSTMAIASAAMLRGAEGHFVGKINAWFDQTMDRVSQRFTLSTRSITLVSGLLLALVLQLDTIALVNRISVDDVLRQSLSNQALKISEQASNGGPGSWDLYRPVIDQGMILIPRYPEDLARFLDWRHVAGILFSAMLLSLGAPFWYNALKQLLQLRSKIAQQDDSQRRERQSTQAGAGGSGAAPQMAVAAAVVGTPQGRQEGS